MQWLARWHNSSCFNKPKDVAQARKAAAKNGGFYADNSMLGLSAAEFELGFSRRKTGWLPGEKNTGESNLFLRPAGS
jgi:hypothetical protein